MANILLIDVPEALTEKLSDLLACEHELQWTTSESLLSFSTHSCDLMILDCCRVGRNDPFIFCRRYRAGGGTGTIVAIVDTLDPDEISELHDAGATACVPRNTGNREFATGINALLNAQLQPNIIRVRDVEIDYAAVRVRRKGEEISLTSGEFNILLLLMQHPNKEFTAERLLERLRITGSTLSIESLRLNVKTLKRKLKDGAHDPFIRADRAGGYKIMTG